MVNNVLSTLLLSQLKKKETIHTTLQRVENVKKYADMVFVIPDTDPTPWIKAMISEQDLKVCVAFGYLYC